MARIVKPCGTEAAYRRHLRNGEEPCDKCKRAAAEKRAQRRGTDKPTDAQKKMRDILVDVVEALIRDSDGKIDYAKEYERLYGYLNGALPHAMPREVSSIVREMRSILIELQTLELKMDDGSDSVAEIQAQFQSIVAGAMNDNSDDLSD